MQPQRESVLHKDTQSVLHEGTHAAPARSSLGVQSAAALSTHMWAPSSWQQQKQAQDFSSPPAEQ